MKKRSVGIALSYINTALNAGCGLVLSSFLIRSLGDTEYGIYQTMGSFVNYLVLFELGVGTVMTRNISLCRNDENASESIKRNTSTIWIITLCLSVVILVLSGVFFVLIDTIYSATLTVDQIVYGKQIFAVLLIHLLTSFLVQTLNGFILGCEHYTFATKVSIVKIVVRTVALVLLISFVKYAVIIAIVDAAIGVLVLIFTYVYCKTALKFKTRLQWFDWAVFRSILPMCMALLLQSIVNQANNNVDKFIISIQIGPESVSLYSIALYIFSLFSSLTTIPISMYMPQVAKDVKSGMTKQELTKRLVQPCRLVVIVGGTVMFGFLAVGRHFISLFYGDDRMLAWGIALIIMAPMFLNMSNGVLINVLDVYNKRHIRSYLLLGTTIVNIGLTVWWISMWGMVGAAIATAISTCIGQVIIMNFYYYKYMQINVFYLARKTFKGLLSVLAVAALLSWVSSAAIPNALIGLIVGMVVFMCVEGGGLLLWGLNSTEKQGLKTFKRR